MPTFKRSLALIVVSALIAVLAFERPDRARDAEFSREGLPLLTAVDELSSTEMLAMGQVRPTGTRSRSRPHVLQHSRQ